ncbi:hypothetical protein ACWGR4_42490 [Embleya sp. NPDC055664]
MRFFRRARRGMARAGAVLSAAVVLVVGSIGPATAGTAEIKRTLHLTAWPTAYDYAQTDGRYIALAADTYVWQVMLYDETARKIVPGSRKERQIRLRADRYFWYCAIYGGDYYRYTQNCALWPNTDEAARAYLITEPFNFPTSGPYTVISRLIGA